MDFPDQPLGDRSTATEPSGHELECVPVVQKLARIVRVRLGHRLSGEECRGLHQLELRPLDVSRMVRLEDECPRAHLPDPVFGQRRRFQKPPRPLDPREIGRDRVGDGEARLEAHPGIALLHVDLAGDGSGDQGGAEFLEVVDGLTDLGDEVVDSRCLAIEHRRDGVLLTRRRERQPDRPEEFASQRRTSAARAAALIPAATRSGPRTASREIPPSPLGRAALRMPSVD